MNKNRIDRHLVSKRISHQVRYGPYLIHSQIRTKKDTSCRKLTQNRSSRRSHAFFYKYSQKFQKQNWESKSVLFNDPSVPVTYPTSGLRVEPDEVLKVPIKITKVCGTIYICKISS